MQHVDEGRLHAWLDGELPAGGPDGARALERHLAGCAACRTRVEEERTIRDAASAILRDADPGPPQVIPIATARPAPRGRRTWVALGWAASVLVALGVGWLARPEPPRTVVLAPSPRTPSPARPGPAPAAGETAQLPASPAPELAPQNRAQRPAAATSAPAAPAPRADAVPATPEEVRGTGTMGEVAAAPPPPPPVMVEPVPPPVAESAPPPPATPPPAPVAVARAERRRGRVEAAPMPPPPPPPAPVEVYASEPSPPARSADSLTVRGRVLDARGQGLSGATVSVPALAARTVTRADGSYTLSVPASRLEGSDSVEVVANRIGMKSQSRSLAAEPESATVDFAMQAEALNLDGLVVTGAGTRHERRLPPAARAAAGEWRAAGRAEAERRLGSPLFIVAGLPVLGIELQVLEESPAARVKQRLPGGEVLTLIQRRASRARQPTPAAASPADAAPLTVRRGRLTVEATAPIPADSLRQLLAPER